MTALQIIKTLKNRRGELATVVALIGLGIVTLGIIAGQRLAKTGPQDTSRAAATGGWIDPNDGTTCNSTNFVAFFKLANCSAGVHGYRTEEITHQEPCSTDGSGECYKVGGTSVSFTVASQWWYDTKSCTPKPPAPPPVYMYSKIIRCTWSESSPTPTRMPTKTPTKTPSPTGQQPPSQGICAVPVLSVTNQSCTSNNQASVTWKWNNISGATQYKLQVDDQSGFPSPVINTIVAPANTFRTTLSSGVTWRGRVRVSAANQCILPTTAQWSNVVTLSTPCSGFPTFTPTPTLDPRCVDSDGGKDYYKRGYTTLNGVRWDDQCYSSTVLLERYCKPTVPVSVDTINYTCPQGCDLGKCKGLSPTPTRTPTPGVITIVPITKTPTPSPTGQQPPGGVCAAPVLSVTNQACTSNNQASVTWKFTKVDSANEYRFQRDNNDSFSSPEKDIKLNATTNTIADSFQGDQWWRGRVRVRSAGQCTAPSAWSNIMAVGPCGTATLTPTKTPSPSPTGGSCKPNSQSCTASNQCCSGFCNSNGVCRTPANTVTPSPTGGATQPPGNCPAGDKGNLDCNIDGCIDTADYELFRQVFGSDVGSINVPSGQHTPDLVQDSANMIDTADYEILRSNFGSCLP
ncbi:hypothetical protein A3J20_06390 [Candidatus Gottesmanbacteria bacterium RIFCSPLOWO2_02_FULL_42_29]|uniref:Dockerin domain-containing protein n=2 Tax=Candidatus Gottesmaniibacteriota TaxID=1752720 RepID=A0A1F6BH55_9BACT|nr:MAG: hypothetical protein UV09_C0001G0044 [Candidatus Gottesmanbacteria bacterium GW2011_GWA2_42_18]OGG11186.1 MAG: hypothetical protein A2781_05365 [Candidatus Gottesmanbacteria bacterium RIFCSPHIGHO2_01_FULL_42_27]OGG21282.1 MAG: hypothetical protein A3E72_05125 [Candidatus Gottesmanbacteria bacterium RIFCSPHIGHO2_12_FULL_43_26]OGG32806.1 MAG: hypothetical protein A3G68_05975 [Candidatus Gottesmanbacteria bacterium RIFCSPLOWO2_12_FULL_42_10]OGG36269.1 MAG: hypothetical protein A2968_04420 